MLHRHPPTGAPQVTPDPLLFAITGASGATDGCPPPLRAIRPCRAAAAYTAPAESRRARMHAMGLRYSKMLDRRIFSFLSTEKAGELQLGGVDPASLGLHPSRTSTCMGFTPQTHNACTRASRMDAATERCGERSPGADVAG